MICQHCGKATSVKINPERIERIKQLSKEGYTVREIAALVSCGFASVARILKASRPGGGG